MNLETKNSGGKERKRLGGWKLVAGIAAVVVLSGLGLAYVFLGHSDQSARESYDNIFDIPECIS